MTQPEPMRCPKCNAIMPLGLEQCLECGYED